MNNLLAQRICEIYPDFFQNRDDTCFSEHGFEIGDGWYPLLASLATQLRALADHTGARLTAEQVREKLGTLRVHFSCNYFSDSDAIEWARLLVEAAEHLSGSICGICGMQSTRLKGEGWLLISCPQHNFEASWGVVDTQAVTRLLNTPLPTIDLSCLPARVRVFDTQAGPVGVMAAFVRYQKRETYIGLSIDAVEIRQDIGWFESRVAARSAIQAMNGQYSGLNE